MDGRSRIPASARPATADLVAKPVKLADALTEATAALNALPADARPGRPVCVRADVLRCLTARADDTRGPGALSDVAAGLWALGGGAALASDGNDEDNDRG